MRSPRIPLILLAVALLLVNEAAARVIIILPPRATPVLDPGESPLRDRREFARALERVQTGMRSAEVRALLGPPDDRWLGEEVNACRMGRWFRPGVEAWCYGGNGHLTFPTLGKVSFDEAGLVVAVEGQGGPLPGGNLPPECQARHVLRMIDGLRLDEPLRMIQVVNALQALGKGAALDVIDEYLRVGREYEALDALWAVMDCLFGVSDPHHREIVMYRDIPLLKYRFSIFGGRRQLTLASYRRTGVFRIVPLEPPNNPLEIVDALLVSPEWNQVAVPAYYRSDRFTSEVREQLLRLVDPVYRLDENFGHNRLTYWVDPSRQDAQWQTHLQRFSEIHARWDPKQNTYVRPDGSFLPALPEPNYVPLRWVVKTTAGAVDVVLKRDHRTWVEYSMDVHDADPKQFRLRVFLPGSPEQEVKPPARGASGGFAALDTSALHVVLKQDEKVVAERLMQP